ncbi:transient receptor potential cation channel subfamily M member-like 2 isoform X2 [Liolophura sinensis]|uniref:transient receptor potential cation channel subfamily M member-like 2 isoform X2 n=1 Tax=Liolophura sinensis TaxID=3198878 RepID=UPI00315935F4
MTTEMTSEEDIELNQMSMTDATKKGGEHNGMTLVQDHLSGSKPKRKRARFDFEGNPKAWAEKAHLMCRICVKFVQKPGDNSDDPLCYCGYNRSQHSESAITTTALGAPNIWNQKEHTKPIPTNAVGEMQFVGFSQKYAKYVRVDAETDANKVWDLMTRVWKLKPPHLIISVTGGAKHFHLTPRLKEVFRKGLIKAALSTDAWITSGGTHTGVMKYVGEAFRDLAMGQSTQNKVVALGIATWGCIMNKESLVNPKDVARYRIALTPGKLEAPIDCNHSHIILVDNGTQHQFGVEIDFRARLEMTIAQRSKEQGVLTSIILVVVEGGPGTLQTVYSSVQKKTPALIVAGSGRAANVLAFAYEHAEEHTIEETDRAGNASKRTVRVMSEKTELEVCQMLEETFRQRREDKVSQYVDWIKHCLQFPDLLTIFTLDSNNSAKDIDLAILKALLKANQEYFIEQLRLALIWNRVDVAKTDIFTDDRTWKLGSLDDVLLAAIQLDRVDFVKLFLQSGVNLSDFLTEEILLKLYNTTSKRSLVHIQLRKLRPTEVKASYTLEDIGRLIKSLMGDYYQPVYLEEARHKQFNPIDSQPDASLIKRKDPERDLFIWSILMGRCDMAKLFWEKRHESLMAALVAHSLLNALQRRMEDNDVKQRLQENALDFQRLAVGMLNTCYEDNEEKTSRLLLRCMQFWGKTNCINIAINSKNKVFIAQTACQELFKDIWWGKLESTNGYLVLPCAVCPLLIYPCLKFKTMKGDLEQDSIQADKYKPTEDVNLPRSFTESSSDESSSTPYENRGLNPFEKILAFFGAPATKFCYNVIFFLLFLLLYSYVMLIQFHEVRPYVPEMVLVAWVLTIFFEEVRQLWKASPGPIWVRVRHYISDRWNILDTTTIVFFAIGFALRFFNSTFMAARLILSINIFGFFLRLLHIFSVSKLMGPKLVMIGKMIWDLLSFMLIMLVFIIGYGITSQSILYPNAELHPMLIVDVLKKAYWQIFAELFLEEIEGQQECNADLRMYSNGTDLRCPDENGKIIVPILLAFYMLLTNVLLLNLLIAMFSNTFQAVQDNADLHWHFQLYKLTQEYYDRPVLPPPFIVIVHLFRLARWCVKCDSNVTYGFLSENEKYTAQERRSLDVFEENRRDEYMLREDKKMWNTTDYKVSTTSERMESLMSKVDVIHDTLSMGRETMRLNLTQEGEKDEQPEPEDLSLTGRVTSLEVEVRKTNEALSWLIAALKDKNIVPQPEDVKALPARASTGRESRREDVLKRTSGRKQPLKRQITLDKNSLVHTKSRSSPYPGTEIHRFEVPEEKVPWQVEFPEYKPPFYTAQTVLQTPPWADEPTLSSGKFVWNQYDDEANVDRSSHGEKYQLKEGCPQNPAGRTGLQGRGLLGRWGPNHATDPVVTRWKRNSADKVVTEYGVPVLEFIAIRRHDNKQWSLPGGLVLPGENISSAVKRTLVKEALSDLIEDERKAAEMKPKLDKLFENGEEVYRGYVDDARNTDNAWIETRAMNYHDDDGTLTAGLKLRAGKSEDAAAWLTVWSSLPLHANHAFILEKVASLRGSSF